ncbi:BTAD domain-containing putative transcriptional regulator [Streptomyces sp. NPDC050504]|uniref:AfsR/SARP family transcriptional regulator n=1 Tax=Streptomyces sp. NPDC050504 TaxID=3365618 RepID=UPI0037B5C8A8
MDPRIRVLGPVALHADPGREIPLGSPKERLMLAALAVAVGRPVSLDTLVDRLWEDAPPSKPRASVHAYATRIRQRLEDAGGGRIVQRARTYTLEMPPECVDCVRYQCLAEQARALCCDDEDTALALLVEADALWRGEPLAGLGGLWAAQVRANLGERRLAAALTRIGIQLRKGLFAEVVPDATELLDGHPDDETLAGCLMTASYGCGRQSDALRVYETLRRRLREEHGTSPGPALARLHGLILDGAPVRDLLTPSEATANAPSTLPAHAELVGRKEELTSILQAAPGTPTVGAVLALQGISGMAGVGKSLLALHAARVLAPRFPDGQIHLDLRSHAPGLQPLTARDALTALLRTFGVPAADIPDDLDGLTTLWRTLLGARRAVVVLDDVSGPEQLRLLLPGASPSLIIVTSRRGLAGLPGVKPLLLDVLPPADAVAMFRKLTGPDRATRTQEVTKIVHLCGYLPLAIELAAGRLISRPSWTTAHLLHRLTRGPGRLREIHTGSREIARAFAVSYRTLSDEEQHVFRLAGLQLGPDFDVFAMAALTGLPTERTEAVLETLLDAHLLREPTPERYAFHDLIGEYSRTLTAAEDTAEEREAALRRLIDFYVRAAAEADRLINPRRLRPGVARSAAHAPNRPGRLWDSAASARLWLTAERTALVAAERHCRGNGRPREAALLAGSLAAFLDEEGYSAEAQQMHSAAARHWRLTREPQAEVHALLDLGNAMSRCGRYEPSIGHARRALRMTEETGDVAAKTEVLHLLGVLHWNLGRLTEALAHQNETLELRRRAGDRLQVARSHNNMGITQLYLGNFPAALENFNAALAGFREVGNMQEESSTLNNMSDLSLQTGDKESARELLREALDLLKNSDTPTRRAIMQINLANTMNSPDDLNQIMDLLRDSLSSFRRTGDLRNASITLHSMGRALHAADRCLEAATHHRQALELSRGIGAAHEQAQALHGLGAAEHRLGQTRSAIWHMTEAISIAERIGAAPEAALARADLAAIRESGATEAGP